MPDGMALSPQIQAFGDQAGGPEQIDQLFKERFNEMAYQVLSSKFSELFPDVVTFKILETDPDEGSAVGVFVINYRQKPVYIPVVMVDSRLKPLEMFYYKDLNIFLPLSLQWLEEISKMALDEQGEGAKLPKEVPQDVNIRDLVLPPMTTTGRVGYASASVDEGVNIMFKEAEDHSLEIHPQFLNTMRNASKVVLDGVKLAFSQNPELLQKFVSNYGRMELTSAMAEGYKNAQETEKTASAKFGKVRVLTKQSSSDQFKEVFGEKAGAAFSSALQTGFAAHDPRLGITKVAVKVEGPAFLESPGPEPGWHRVWFVDGKPGIYFVIPFPRDTRDCCCCRPIDSRWGNKHVEIEYLLISQDGKEVWTTKQVVGQRIYNFENDEVGIKNSKIFKLLNADAKGDTPTPSTYGYFINVGNRGVEATRPFRIDKVIKEGDITRIIGEYGRPKIVIDGDPSRKRINSSMGGGLMFMPNTAKFVQIMKIPAPDSLDGDRRAWEKVRNYERERKNSVIKDPKLLFRWMNHIIQKANGMQVNVKSAGLNQWWINNGDHALYVGEALEKVANLYDVSVEDAAGILLDAQKHGVSSAHILDAHSGGQLKQAFEKIAQPQGTMPQEGPMEYQSQPGQQQGLPQVDQAPMQPQQQGEIPMGMGAPPVDPMAQQAPPSPLSPTDLAIGEAIEGLQQQNQMMQQENQAAMAQLHQKMESESQSNQQLVGVLQGIQQRANELSDASGGQIPAGAEESPAVAAQMIAPTPPMMPEPPPMPMMDQEGLTPEMVAEQINPAMVDQAAAFQDQGMFDTAAIAMLAAAPVLQDIVASYVPNMEKAVDNLGRVLLTLWMKEKETREALGDDEFISLEDKLRTVFKNMGDVVLDLSHSAMAVQSDADKAQVMMQNSRG